jgi:glycosyltransferase involved in cell wall biosynthesis
LRSGGDPVLLYSGRFADVKGTNELFEAAAILLDQFPMLRLVLAGGNPESPRSERRWLRRMNDLIPEHLRQRVEHLGWLSRGRLDEGYRRATALLCPSWFESFGLAALESMAQGTPVIGTTGGALPELVTHQKNGLLSPPREVAPLVAHARRVLEDPVLTHGMGCAALHTVATRYSWSAVATAHRRLYRSLLGIR